MKINYTVEKKIFGEKILIKRSIQIVYFNLGECQGSLELV